MNPPAATRYAIASLLILLAACSKKPGAGAAAKPAAVELVPEAERSRHFEAVNSHLELGGTLYGYADVDGDVLAIAGSAQELVRQIAIAQPKAAMFAKQDFKALFTELGLNDVKAIGLSSVHEAGGSYRNRAFLYTPEGRHGIFAVFGGQPGRFVGARLAPPDTDFYGEHEFDVTVLYDAVKSVIAKVNGPDAAAGFEEQVKKVGAKAMFSLLELIEGLNGRATIIVRLDPVKNVALPGSNPVNIPAFSALVMVDGIGPVVERALSARTADLETSQEGTRRLFTYKGTPPVEGFKYVLAVDGKTLYAASSAEFLHECLQRKDGLDTNASFSSALAALGPEGNGLTWISPRFVSRLRGLGAINPQVNPQAKRVFENFALNLPEVSQPLLSVRTNLPDGILIRSTWNRSLKADVAMFTIYNPVTVGLLAAMAIPAFEKVRTNSQTMAVYNNLRMLSAAADQYYLENGVNSANFDSLVGPGRLIKSVTPVAGEDYRSMTFKQGLPLTVRLPDGRVISYPPPTPRSASSIARPPRRDAAPAAPGAATALPDGISPEQAITENLRKLDAAANRFYAENGTTTTTFEQLVGPGRPIPSMTPVAGEDYRSLLFKQGRPLRLYLREGNRVIVYPPQ
jgi:type II secretory pathway pseudopilin PulG